MLSPLTPIPFGNVDTLTDPFGNAHSIMPAMGSKNGAITRRTDASGRGFARVIHRNTFASVRASGVPFSTGTRFGTYSSMSPTLGMGVDARGPHFRLSFLASSSIDRK